MILDGNEVVDEIIRYLSTFDDYEGRVTDDLYSKTVSDLIKESVPKEVVIVEYVDTDFENSANGYPIYQMHNIDFTILRPVRTTDTFSSYRNSIAAVGRDIIIKIKEPEQGTLNMPDVDIEFKKSTPGELMVGSVKCTAINMRCIVKTYFENPNT